QWQALGFRAVKGNRRRSRSEVFQFRWRLEHLRRELRDMRSGHRGNCEDLREVANPACGPDRRPYYTEYLTHDCASPGVLRFATRGYRDHHWFSAWTQIRPPGFLCSFSARRSLAEDLLER